MHLAQQNKKKAPYGSEDIKSLRPSVCYLCENTGGTESAH